MELTEELKNAIKRLNSISSLQIIENVNTVEELEDMLPGLYAEADAITYAIQRIEVEISNTKEY